MKPRKALFSVTVVLLVGVLFVCGAKRIAEQKAYTSMGFAMDTVVTQTAYGKNAEKAMQTVTGELARLEAILSPYREDSEIAGLNRSAGKDAVTLSGDTFALLRHGTELSALSEGYFQLSIAPLTRLWGITGEHPAVPDRQTIESILPLIDDTAIQLHTLSQTAYLPLAGQSVDVGGVAKGYACEVLRQVYLQNGVDHALLSVGGNLCCVGGLPNGEPFRIGFRDPNGGETSYIASFLLKDGIVAVSGGYERYFEQDGIRYHHILDPHTGYPVKTDLSSVGVIGTDGTAADFWSTTLFSWGREKAVAWMKTAPYHVLLLTEDGTLYVSDALRDGFECDDDKVKVVFVPSES